MASTGAAGDVQALLASEFWQRGGDGRSSRAMLELIEDLRALKQAGRPLDLFAFDDQPGFHACAAPGGDSRTYRLPSLTASLPAAEWKKPAP